MTILTKLVNDNYTLKGLKSKKSVHWKSWTTQKVTPLEKMGNPLKSQYIGDSPLFLKPFPYALNLLSVWTFSNFF